MKRIISNIVIVLLWATVGPMYSNAQERTVEDDIFYFDSISEVLQDCFQGWTYDKSSREWYGNANLIRPEKISRAFRKAKNGGFEYSHFNNIYNLQTASFVWNENGSQDGMRFYVLFWQRWKGFYDYPLIMEDWRCYRACDIYIFPESEWLKFQSIQVGETQHLRFWYVGEVTNKKPHLLNDDVYYTMTHYSSKRGEFDRVEEEGQYSLYVRYADDGKNIRFIQNDTRYSRKEFDKAYFEVPYTTFERIMRPVDKDNLGKFVIKAEQVYVY